MDLSNENGTLVSGDSNNITIENEVKNTSQMNLGNGDVGNNNTITIQQNNPEKNEELVVKYEDSNSDLIEVLKKELAEKNIQINNLIQVISKK